MFIHFYTFLILHKILFYTFLFYSPGGDFFHTEGGGYITMTICISRDSSFFMKHLGPVIHRRPWLSQ